MTRTTAIRRTVRSFTEFLPGVWPNRQALVSVRRRWAWLAPAPADGLPAGRPARWGSASSASCLLDGGQQSRASANWRPHETGWTHAATGRTTLAWAPLFLLTREPPPLQPPTQAPSE